MLIVTNTINSLSISDNKLTIVSSIVNNTISISSVGIQGSSGNLVVSSGDANKILTNNGISVEWTDIPTNLTLNGGYF